MYLIEPLSDNTKGDHAFYKQEHLRKKRSAYGDSVITVYDKEPRTAALFKRSSWVGDLFKRLHCLDCIMYKKLWHHNV